jgi:hypothetical protein
VKQAGVKWARLLLMYAEHYADDLEIELDEAILHDFNVDAEDGSPKEASGRDLLVFDSEQSRQAQTCGAGGTTARLHLGAAAAF